MKSVISKAKEIKDKAVERYNAPTPNWATYAGNGLEAIGVVLGVAAFFTPIPWAAGVTYGIGRLSKIILKFSTVK